MSLALTTAEDVRRRLRRAAYRNTYRAFSVYAYGVAVRGRVTRSEVRAMRMLLDLQMSRSLFRPDPATQVEPVRVRHAGGQVRGEWVEWPGVSTRTDKVLLYVHGGAFVAGSMRSHRGLTSELARRSRRSVFAVDYRLAPQHCFPIPGDDVLRAYSWLLSTGVPAAQIVIAGDSAGGHLALGLTPRAVRAGLPAPAGVVAFSPVVDPSMELSRACEAEQTGNNLAVWSRVGRAWIQCYHPGVAADHPELLLTLDDLSVMPPVLIQASDSEILTHDAEHYIEALQASGGTGELQLFPRQWHVFQVMGSRSRAASEALDRATAFIDSVT